MNTKITLYEIEKNGKRIPVSEKELSRRAERNGVRKGDIIFAYSYVYVNGEKMTAQNVPLLVPVFERFKQEDYEELEGVDDFDTGKTAKLLAIIKEKNPSGQNIDAKKSSIPQNLKNSREDKTEAIKKFQSVGTAENSESVEKLLEKNSELNPKAQKAEKVFNTGKSSPKSTEDNIEDEFADGISDELFATTMKEVVTTEVKGPKKLSSSGEEVAANRTQKAAAEIEKFQEKQKKNNKKLIVLTTIYSILTVLIISIIVLACQTRLFEDISRKIKNRGKTPSDVSATFDPNSKADDIDKDNVKPEQETASKSSEKTDSNAIPIPSGKKNDQNEKKFSVKDPAKSTSSTEIKNTVVAQHDPNESPITSTDSSLNNAVKNTPSNVSSTSAPNKSSQNNTLKNSPKNIKDQSVKDQSGKDQSVKDQSVKDQSVKDQSVKDQSVKDQSKNNAATIKAPSPIKETSVPEAPISDKGSTREDLSETKKSSGKATSVKEDLSQYELSRVIAGWKGNLDILLKDPLAGKVSPEKGNLAWGSRVGKAEAGPKGTPKTALLLNGNSEKITFLFDAFPEGDFIINLDFLIESFPSRGVKAKVLSACGKTSSDDPVSLVLGADHQIFGVTEGYYKSGDILYEYIHKTDPFAYSLGIWYHLIVVRKSGLMYFYIDGKILSAPFKVSSEKTKTKKLSLGGSPSAEEFAACRIANFIFAIPKKSKP